MGFMPREKLTRIYVRSTPRSRTALKRVLTEVNAIDPAVTQEILVTSSWLWMETIPPNQLVQVLAPHLATVKGLMGIEVPEDPPGPGPEPEGPLDMVPVSNADTSRRQPSAPRVQRDDPSAKGPRRPKGAR